MSRSSNLLIDQLPEAVVVGGVSYEINTDFRIGIMFDQMLCDLKLSDEEKVEIALGLYFKDAIPRDIDAALNELLLFYRCGSPPPPKPRKPRKEVPPKPPVRLLDYDHDAPLIYAAFLSQYGIDLQDIVDLHWWKFSAMMEGLKDDEEICKIMSYRAVDLNGIKDKAERARYAKLKAKYALPNDEAIAEKKALAEALFLTKEEPDDEDRE